MLSTLKNIALCLFFWKNGTQVFFKYKNALFLSIINKLENVSTNLM